MKRSRAPHSFAYFANEWVPAHSQCIEISRPAIFPQLFPIPHPGRHLVRQPESELMREHTHLPPMVGFVGKHVAQHFHANRPRPSPAVSQKLLDPAPTTAERFSEHLRAPSGALGQSRAGLLRRAVRAVELS